VPAQGERITPVVTRQHKPAARNPRQEPQHSNTPDFACPSDGMSRNMLTYGRLHTGPRHAALIAVSGSKVGSAVARLI